MNNNKDIKDSVEKIREECDTIEESVSESKEEENDEDEDKNGKTRGDPIVELF